jgi:polar amino acid transport system substrate-binding protein
MAEGVFAFAEQEEAMQSIPGAQMKRALICTVAALLVGCASMSSAPPPEVRGELAPTGKLRVGLILSNQVLVTKDPKTGELQGVTVMLAKKLADRLGVPVEPVGYPNPAGLVRSFGANEWDIAFLAYDPARAQEVDFSPAYMVVDNTYLVPAGSKLQTADAADRSDVKIAVPERSAPDLFLSRSLKAAEIVHVPGGSDAALEALRSGRADAYAENAHMLSLYSERLPGSRVLEGRYTVIQHAVATPKGKAAAAQYVRQFVEESKSDGTVRDAITRARLHRASPAP